MDPTDVKVKGTLWEKEVGDETVKLDEKELEALFTAVQKATVRRFDPPLTPLLPLRCAALPPFPPHTQFVCTHARLPASLAVASDPTPHAPL